MTTRALLDPRSADRLRKLCGMFGSAHDGERASAAAMADKLVRTAGLTWNEIIAPPIVPNEWRPMRYWRDGSSDWQRMAQFCHVRQWLLSEKERRFVRSMIDWRGEPTERQREWLLDLYARLHGGAQQ